MRQTLLHKTKSFGVLSFNDRNFLLDGQDYFLLSGELHYFRIEAGLWKTHLRQMKKAGLNTVSTYIPWSLHEQAEGRPDFRGAYAPNLNLLKFIELCAEMDLYLTVKPGPYILAELAMHGLPKWFFEKYPQAAACDPAGRPYPVKYACLSHPDYLKKRGSGWMRFLRFWPLIRLSAPALCR
jgi:beta-galactosidase